MILRSLASLRFAAFLAALLAVSACTDDRLAQLSSVEIIDIPAADAGPQANQNINNPTLEIPETFPVVDGDQLTLVWSEEFSGPEIDPEVWFFATGDGTEKGIPGGWGNDELQYYLPDNAMIVNGVLEITARRETVGGLNYTSARINTEDRFAFKYGRIEASIKLPAGQGLWPAFWMLSQDSDYLCGGDPCVWAATGEIDIMEAVNLGGTGGNEIFGTLHYGGEGSARIFTGDTYTPSVDVTEDFHTYALEWDEFEIRWYFDGQLYAMQNSWDSSADGKDFPAPFDQPFHILLNVAVGGNFPGSPNGTTPFPATMEVDWVRVYSGEAPPPPPPPPPFDSGLLTNGDFEAGVDPWIGNAANVVDDGGNNVNSADVATAGDAFAVNLSQVLTITQGETYTLTFKARSDGTRTMLAGIGLNEAPFTNVTEIVNLTAEWQTFEFEFTATDFGNANSRVLFDMGADTGLVLIDDVSLVVSTGGGGEPFDSGLLTNGDFEAGVDPWIGNAANVVDDGGNNVNSADVATAGDPFAVNLSQVLTITQGETYTLTFKARSDGTRTMLAGIGLNEAPFTNVTEIVNLTAEWQTFEFEFTATDFGNANSRVLFDMGADTGLVLIDDVSLVVSTSGGTGGGTVLATFDEVTPPAVNEFGGAVATIEAGPAGGDGNALRVLRDGGQAWAGGWVAIPAIPSNAGTQTVSALVYSPTAGIPMVAKAEFAENAGTGEIQANETVVVGWQTLTWTFTNLDPAQVYNRFVILPNLGTVDTATNYFFDNITLLEGGGGSGGGGGGGGGSAAGDIAVNGGFESGDFGGWELFPNGGIQTIVTDNPSSGTYAANLNVPVRTQTDPAVDNLIKNANLEAGNLTPGASVTVSFDMRGSLSGAGGVVFAEFFSELTGGGTSKAEIFSGGPLAPNTNWTNYSYTTTLGPDVSGGVTLQLKTSCGPVEGCGVDAYFDNVAIVIN